MLGLLVSISILLASSYTLLHAAPEGTSQEPSPTPSTHHQIYQPQDPSGYVPHATYPTADGYGPPVYDPSLFALYPGLISHNNQDIDDYVSSVVPANAGFVTTLLRALSKVGLLLAGSFSLLVLGGIFMTLLCSSTPLCNISFAGIGSLNKDFVTAENVATAAAFVEDAVNKYKIMQRSTNTK